MCLLKHIYLKMDVDDSFGEDFGDVLISHPFLEQSPITSQSKRESSVLMNEMRKQLEVVNYLFL